MKTITELRQEIVDRSLQAFHEGLFSGTSGNMSCYLREEDLMLITPTSVRYDVMRAEDIVALRLDGTVVEGHLKPSSEWRMHAAVYEGCPDVNAVFHTHSPYATAFAVNHQTIPAVLIEALVFLGGDICCADYATPGTKEVGLNAVPALEGRRGCTLANHGVLAVGGDLAQAYLNAEYIEDVAKIYTIARSVGTPVELKSLENAGEPFRLERLSRQSVGGERDPALLLFWGSAAQTQLRGAALELRPLISLYCRDCLLRRKIAG